MIKLAVFDLDNTLLCSDKSISAYSIDVLTKLRSKGCLIAYATARPERALGRHVKSFVPNFVIANNGAVIVKNGKVIYSCIINNEIINTVLSQLADDSEITCISAEVGEFLYTNYQGPSWGEGWNPIYNDFKSTCFESVIKISTECENLGHVASIIEQYPDLHFYGNTGEPWQQIMNADATKFNAIKRISELYNIDISDIAAFGDDFNDIEMLRSCGIGVAMGNAIDEAKAAVDYVCGTNDNDGAAKWIEKNLL